MELVFVVDCEKANKKDFIHGKFGYWDILNQKIWVWLFNFNANMNTMVERLCYVIEHEWLHELFARNVSYRYRSYAHWIISHLQSWRISDEQWVAELTDEKLVHQK